MLASWAALFASAVAFGGSVCAALVARRGHVLAWMGPAVVSAAAAVASVVMVSRSSGRLDTTFVATLIGAGAAFGGFLLAATLTPALTRLPPLPAVDGTSSIPPSSRVGSPAYILLADGQPERYEPSTVTQAFDLLAETDVLLPPEALRVFAYLSQRVRYHAAGIGPSRPVVRAVAARFEDQLREQGVGGPIHEAWLQGTPRLADAIAEAAAAGAGNVVVVHLGLTESAEYDRARRDAQAYAATAGMRILHTAPLWSEIRVARLVADQALREVRSSSLRDAGIILVSAGQPWQWDRLHPASAENENYFLQRVRSMLVAAGANESHVRTASIDWQTPDVTEVVRHLAALGCDPIVVMPVTMPADTIETIVDLPTAAEQADVRPSVKVGILHGWGDDPVVSQVLADIAAQMLRDADRARISSGPGSGPS